MSINHLDWDKKLHLGKVVIFRKWVSALSIPLVKMSLRKNADSPKTSKNVTHLCSLAAVCRSRIVCNNTPRKFPECCCRMPLRSVWEHLLASSKRWQFLDDNDPGWQLYGMRGDNKRAFTINKYKRNQNIATMQSNPILLAYAFWQKVFVF